MQRRPFLAALSGAATAPIMIRDIPTTLSSIARGLSDISTAVAAATEPIDRSEIQDAVASAAGEDVAIKWTDGDYYAPQPEAVPVVRGLGGAAQTWLPYRSDRYDCDNFSAGFQTLAALLAGTNAVGIVLDWGASHAYAIIVDSDGELHAVEPQSGQSVALGEEMYRLNDALIIF